MDSVADLHTANKYLTFVATHKPTLLEIAGSDAPSAEATHRIFNVFADAIGGDEDAKHRLESAEAMAAAVVRSHPASNDYTMHDCLKAMLASL